MADEKDDWQELPPAGSGGAGGKDDWTEEPLGSSRRSSYEGIPDDELNLLQRGERKLVDWGLVKPGMEMVSPPALHQKKLALETAANTLTAGYLPQIYGAAKSMSVSGPDYLKNRDAMVAELGEAKGGTKAIGTALGVLPTLAAGPIVAPAQKLGTRILQQGALAGAQGFLANPGDKPGEYNPTQLSERAGNAASAAKWGAGLTAAFGLPELRDYFRKSANMRAVKAGGAMLKDYRALDHQGRLDDTGQMLLHPIEDGAGGTIQVVTPGASLQDVADRTEKLMQAHGQKIQQVENALDRNFQTLSQHPQAGQLLPNPHDMAAAIEKELITPMRGNTAMEDFVPQLEKYVERLRAKPNAPMTFAQARAEKAGFDKLVNWDREGSVGKELAKQVRGVINQNIETAVDNVGKAVNFPLYENWKRSKQIYGAMKGMNDIATDKIFRNEANRFISPSDYGTGIGGMAAAAAAHGDLGPKEMVAGAALGTANHLMRRYGNATAAVGAQKAADLFSRPDVAQAGAYLSSKVQPAVAAGVQGAAAQRPEAVIQRLSSNPQTAHYASYLQKAAAEGPDRFASRYFLLSQSDPNFRAALDDGQ